MRLVQAALFEQLAPGQMLEVIDGADTYIVCNHRGQLHALDGICPHQMGPLSAGNFINGKIVCPYHAWEFDCVSGAYDFNPNVKLNKYPVHIDSGKIQIEIPETLA